MLKKIINLIFNTSLKQKKAFLKENVFTDSDENVTRLVNIVKKTTKDYNDFVIADIGAFDGATSIKFSKEFPKNRILAFEANPESFILAQNNCSIHSNIHLFNVAISSQDCISELNITRNKVSSSLNKISATSSDTKNYNQELATVSKINIETKPLDHYSKDQQILFIKIDVQGHEIQVLEGAPESLKNARYLLIEMSNHTIYSEGCKYYEVDAWLRNHNYKLVDIIVTTRKSGLFLSEFDAIYMNLSHSL
ncbi:MAG: hypothetical protein JWO32_1092 [Bacteroidetes bacterium]|nr:hypothetical protein [Bacteroidota bacterium]